MLHRLRDEGNTVVVIEHNLDVIKTADWVIDPGPEGRRRRRRARRRGHARVQLARAANSFTGRYLGVLARGKKAA